MAKISKNEVHFDNMVYGELEHDVEPHNNDEGLEAEVHDGQVCNAYCPVLLKLLIV